jgi:hypothetical protein
MNLVIEYYEYLNPADAKKINKFLADLAKDGDKKYLEDIMNIKFIAYTARDPYQSVFFKYLNEIDIVDYKRSDKKSQQYNGVSNKLYIRLYGPNGDGKNDPRGAYVTLFHEIGHAIDDLIVKDNKVLFFIPNMKSTHGDGITVFNAAENDVRENIKRSVEEYVKPNGYTPNFKGFKDEKSIENKTYEGVISIYTSNFFNTTNATMFNGISDVYGGFTGNKLSSSYSHSKSYWTNLFKQFNGLQGEELFAHAFARYMTSNDNTIEAMMEHFPTAMETIEEIFYTQKGN